MSSTFQIKERIANSVIHELKKVDNTISRDPLRKAVEDALSIAIAGEIKLMYKLLEEASRQGCPLTATSSLKSSIGQLENWGRVKLRRDPFPAVPGEYEIEITGTGTIPAGTAYVDDVTEFVYLLIEDVVVDGTATGTVRSVGEGVELVKEIGTTLFTQQRVLGVEDEVTITAILTEPEPAETPEEYLEKILQSFATTPRGGAKGDYIVWGLEVAGTFRIYPYTGVTPNIGNIYVQSNRTEGNPNGIPDEDIVNAVFDYLEVREPMTTGELNVYPINIREYEIEVSGLTDPAKEDLVQPALEEFFRAKFPFISGIDDIDLRTDRITKAEIMKTVFDAVRPAGIADVTVRKSALVITDDTLEQGTIGIPVVSFV